MLKHTHTQRKLPGALAATFSFFVSRLHGWFLPVCLPTCPQHPHPSPPTPAKAPHSSQSGTSPPLWFCPRHPLDSTLSLSKLVLLPPRWPPGRLLPWPHHNTGHILSVSVPMAHCPSNFQRQVKNPIDPVWLSEPESGQPTTEEPWGCLRPEDNSPGQSSQGGGLMGQHSLITCRGRWGVCGVGVIASQLSSEFQ